jgi:hypothetical protein
VDARETSCVESVGGLEAGMMSLAGAVRCDLDDVSLTDWNRNKRIQGIGWVSGLILRLSRRRTIHQIVEVGSAAHAQVAALDYGMEDIARTERLVQMRYRIR